MLDPAVNYKAVLTRDGRLGFVPESTLGPERRAAPQCSRLAYYHGRISRRQAEARLRAAGAGDGAYLVRLKDADASLFALSLCAAGAVEHHLLRLDAPGTGPAQVNGAALRGCCSMEETIAFLSDPRAVSLQPLPPLLRQPIPPPRLGVDCRMHALLVDANRRRRVAVADAAAARERQPDTPRAVHGPCWLAPPQRGLPDRSGA